MKSYLIYLNLWKLLHIITLRSINDDEVIEAHTKSFLDRTKSLISDSKDVIINPISLKLSQMCSGTLKDLINKVLNNKLDGGIALLRPPGHHSERNRSMGFCMYKINILVIII